MIRRRSNKQGFTLVEVMVALAVVAIALPALLSQLIQFLDAGAHIRDKTYAAWVAQNQLEGLRLEYALNDTLLKGRATGEAEMAGRTWHWQITSELQPSEVVPGIWKQTVSVGTAPDNSLVTVVGFMREQPQPLPGQ